MGRPVRRASAPRRVPRAARRLLEALLPEREREPFLGDLEERLAEHPGGARGWRATLRLWREIAAALVLLAPMRRPRPAALDRPGDPLMHGFAADLRHGLRLLRRAPAFTALCTLSIGLGVGMTTAIVSIVGPVLLQPLPFPDPERLVVVWERGESGESSRTGFETFTDLARESRTLAGAAAISGWEPTLWTGEGDAERLDGQRVSASFFGVLGVRPALGRDFRAEEDAPDPRVVMIAHGLWTRRFAADSALVGRAISLDGVPFTVVGVLPAGFDDVLSPGAQIWRPLGYAAGQPWACRTCRHLRMVARVRPDASLAAAAADLDAISARLVADHPTSYPAAGVRVVPLGDEVTRAFRPVLIAVLGAAGLVLLLAAANVAYLQLARALRREEEFAVRVALGAGRPRLARQLLAEGVLLAVLGGVAGLVVAALALPALLARLPESLPRLAAVRLDVAALLGSAAVILAAGVGAGLAPTWQGGHATLAALRSGTRLVGSRRRLARAGLVVTEVALALVLLVGAGLLARSLVGLMAVDAGFEPSRLLTLDVQAIGPRYEREAAVYENRERMRAAIRAIPGVADVAVTNQLPLGGSMDMYGVRAQDRPLANPQLAPAADRYTVSPEFMRTMGIPLLRGRGFAPADARDSAEPVAIVSAALAARIWGEEDPIGKRIQLGGSSAPWRRVVGVAGNVRHAGLDASVTQQVYVPERQWPWADAFVTLVVRTHGEPTSVAAAVRRAARAVDATQPVGRVATMEQVMARSTAQRRLALLLFAAFAGAAVALAAAGIYGVLSGSVAERTREIGVRTALGATPGDIVGLVLRQGAILGLVGLAVGAAGALALGRLLEALLFGVRPSDPLTLAGVAALLALVTLAACLVPARHAMRVNPMDALRSE